MFLKLLGWLGVVVLQIAMTQAVTFFFSLAVPGAGISLPERPVLLALILVLTFSAGVFLGGWLAQTLRWVRFEPLYPARLGGAAAGTALPLALALLLYRTLKPGSPFFLISILAGILGFYLPGWLGTRRRGRALAK